MVPLPLCVAAGILPNYHKKGTGYQAGRLTRTPNGAWPAGCGFQLGPKPLTHVPLYMQHTLARGTCCLFSTVRYGCSPRTPLSYPGRVTHSKYSPSNGCSWQQRQVSPRHWMWKVMTKPSLYKPGHHWTKLVIEDDTLQWITIISSRRKLSFLALIAEDLKGIGLGLGGLS